MRVFTFGCQINYVNRTLPSMSKAIAFNFWSAYTKQQQNCGCYFSCLSRVCVCVYVYTLSLIHASSSFKWYQQIIFCKIDGPFVDNL